MTTYEPGLVAVVNGRRALRVGNIGWHIRPCTEAEEQTGADFVSDSEVTYVRPLVVLDIDALAKGYAPNPTPAATLSQLLRCLESGLAEDIADQIEAQTRPPRIPEPSCIGAVVRAAQVGEVEGSERPWTKFRNGGWIDTLDHIRTWSDLDSPILIRDGVDTP